MESLSSTSISSLSLFLKRKRQEIGVLEAFGYLGAGLLLYGAYKILRNYFRWLSSPLRALPSPSPENCSFWVGAFPQIQKEPFLAPHKKWFARAGPEAKLIHYTTILGRSSLLVLDKEIVRKILTAPAGKPNPRFKKSMAFVKTVLGDGLVALEGTDWMRHRKILQPAFNTAIIRQSLDQVVPEKVSQLIAYWEKAQGREIDAHSHLSALTLDIIGPTAFSHEFHGLNLIREWAQDAQKRTYQN